MRYLDSKTPSEPELAPVSVNRSSLSEPLKAECRRTGCGCQEWPLMAQGVEWSPVMARTSGFLRSRIGSAASNSSMAFFFAGEIAVFAVLVGVFEVDEEEIEVVVFGEVPLELLPDGLRPLDLLHADELGQALVHRIDGQARRAELVALLEQGNVRLMGDAAHEKAVGGFLPGDDGQGLLCKTRPRVWPSSFGRRSWGRAA